MQALKIVDIERPNDPISFIALYLLKNKEKVKLPALPPDYFLEKTDENPMEENENLEKHEEVPDKKEKDQLAKKNQEKDKKPDTKIKK